jgi:CheY-specific phosphatase CheX
VAFAISSNAQSALQQMVIRAIQASPLVQHDQKRNVEIQEHATQASTERAVVLTVSSYQFRLTMLIQFRNDMATRTHFATFNRMNVAEMGEQEFVDAIREAGNICCGNLNRDLVGAFAHVGMSTPNIVDQRCVDYLGKLSADYVRHFEMLDDAGPPFAVTVCINAFAPLDFSADFSEAEETGELEMF